MGLPPSLAVLVAVLVAAAGAPRLAAAAETPGGPQFKLSGYGTLAGTVTDEDGVAFRSSARRSKGVTQDVDLGDLSRAGVQGSLEFDNGFSAVAQVVLKRRIDGDTRGGDKLMPRADWLYAQYEPVPAFSVRLGRLAQPTYLFSDTLDVGYAAPWLRAPVHFYGAIIETFDGAQATWRHSAGGLNFSSSVLYGESKSRFYAAPRPTTAIANLERLWGGNFIVEWDDLLARVGFVRSQGPALTETITDTYKSVGLQYDNGRALVLAEYAQRRQSKLVFLGNQPLAKADFGYAAAGWRFGKWLPMAIYSHNKQGGGLGGGSFVSFSHSAAGASLRYDPVRNVAVKAQYERYAADDILPFVIPRTGDRSKVNVFSFGVDVIF